MPRRAVPHNKAALKVYAQRVRDLAKQVDAVAEDLGTRGEDCYVPLSYHRGFEKGLKAIALLVGDVQKKITQEKFSFGKVAIAPVGAPKKMVRKKTG